MKVKTKGWLITEKSLITKSREKESKALRKTGKRKFLPVFSFLFLLACSNAFPDDQISPTQTTDTSLQTSTFTLTAIATNTPSATPTNTPQFIITVTEDKTGTATLGDIIHFTIYYDLVGSYTTPNAFLNVDTVNNVANKSGYIIGIPSPKPLEISNIQQPAIAWNVGPPDSVVSNISGQLDFYYEITSTANPTFGFYAYWNDGMTLGGAYSDTLYIVTATTTATFTSSPTITITNTPTVSFTDIPTGTFTLTFTGTPTLTQTVTETFTSSETGTYTSTETSSPTNTLTVTSTESETETMTDTITSTFISTLTPTPTVSQTNTLTLTLSETPSLTCTSTPSFTFTSTQTLTQTYTVTQTFTPSDTETAKNTPTQSFTTTAVITAAVTATVTTTQAICLELQNTAKEGGDYKVEYKTFYILKNCSNTDIDLSTITLRIYTDYKDFYGDDDKTGNYKSYVWTNDKNLDSKGYKDNDSYRDDQKNLNDCRKINFTNKTDGCGNEYIEISFNACAGMMKEGSEIKIEMPSKLYDTQKTAIFVNENMVYGNMPACVTPVATKPNEKECISELNVKETPVIVLTDPDENNVYNFPNPCKDTTTIRFPLAEPANLKIIITDINGNIVWVKDLASSETTAGINYVKWACVNNAGMQVSNGVYLLKFMANGKIITKKIAVTR